ncbi:reverse transcriptase domain-containing protein [Tanacetum coccineum]
MNELNELRDQAYENSLIYKEKTKKIHDSKIKNRVFNVGDRVLLFNSRLKIFSGKLKTRWTEPFTVAQVFPYGAVELSQTDGPNFKVNDQASVFMEMTSVHISSSLVLHQMMSDHNSSDLAPQRQEMSVENVSSGLVPQAQKASDYENSDPVPPRQNVVPTAEKTASSQQGLEFLSSPLLGEYYNPAISHAEDNNDDQAPNASFQEDEFINPFCTRVQETGESSLHNIDNTDVHSFQPQIHDYRWTRDHPLEQVRGNPTMPVQTRRQLATDPEMCYGFELTAFSDADHAGCIDTRKSTSGGIQFLVLRLRSWMSLRNKTATAMSSCRGSSTWRYLHIVA